jgi:benzaldehyde dehydrogenase (NAD)
MALPDTDIYRGLELTEPILAGMVHINDQTIADDPVAPFGGIGASGSRARRGSPQANLKAFTETQCITVRGALPTYPY